jgi:exoribonuclease R
MIPGIIELSSKTIYGLTSRNVPIYRFKPLNTKLSEYLVGCSYKDRSRNMLGLIEDTNTQRSNLIRIIGPCGDINSEREALLLQYSKNTWKKFDSSALDLPNFEKRKRVDGYTFNIDPEGCKDIDDVITIGNDGYIYITIADVASWMVKNPDILIKASKIGQTLYKDGKVVSSLLPIEDKCSLIPNKERLGISLKFKWNGMISDVSFEQVVIVNNESLTYEEAYESKYSKLLKDIASYLASKEISDSHEWIEQLMIFYNCEVAKLLVETKKGILRSQDPPEIEKMEIYKNFIDVNYLSNKSAKYTSSVNPEKHWGLQKDYYCHATSPIRRFADIINQMVICNYTIPEIDYDKLNELQKDSKKYERESFFLEKILGTSNRTVKGLVLSDHRIWVSEWNRIITCKNNFEIGTIGTLKYSLDMNQVTWKRRMVFKFEDTNYQE